jgi:hypothetical protein
VKTNGKADHPRERIVFWRDPQIEAGPFRVLPRTDGKFVVVDTRRPLGERTVLVLADLKSAERACQRLAKEAASGAAEGIAVALDERGELSCTPRARALYADDMAHAEADAIGQWLLFEGIR